MKKNVHHRTFLWQRLWNVWNFIKTFYHNSYISKMRPSRAARITRRADVDFMKPATSVSTLILIPGVSWEQLPRRTRPEEAVIDQFLKSNVPNWPAAPVRSSPERLYLTKRCQSGHLSHRKVCSTTIHASCSFSKYTPLGYVRYKAPISATVHRRNIVSLAR